MMAMKAIIESVQPTNEKPGLPLALEYKVAMEGWLAVPCNNETTV